MLDGLLGPKGKNRPVNMVASKSLSLYPEAFSLHERRKRPI